MTDLYIIFFVVGAVLFAMVVLYSYFVEKRAKQTNVRQTTSQKSGSPHDELIDTNLNERKALNVAGSELSESAKVTQGDHEPVQTESLAGTSTVTDSALSHDTARGALTRAKSALSNIKKAAQGGVPSNNAPLSIDSAPSGRAAQNDTGSTSKVEPQLGNEEQPLLDQPKVKAKIATDANKVITDLVAKVLNPNPIEQSDLLSLFREHDFKFHRKVHIYGLNELTDMWRDIEFELPTARFLELGISIQLCDRDGAMTQKELHDFQQMVLQFCERYDAPFEFSVDIEAALTQAQALDQVGRRYDSMAVLNVVPKSKVGFRMADIQSCARDLMMSTDKNGIFMKTEGQKNNITVLFRLACTDGAGHFGLQATGQALSTPVHDLVVYMNVPATREPETVFQQMVKDANDLATWLDGKVVDRTGKAMTQRTYSALMQQISDIAYSMQQDGLVPGDIVAKKLF